MKPSDDPRCPFNWRHPDYKFTVDWTPLVMQTKYSAASTAVVNEARKKGKDIGTVTALSNKPTFALLSPKNFHVYMKAIASGTNKRPK